MSEMMRIVEAKPMGRLARPDTLRPIREATTGCRWVRRRLPAGVEDYARRGAEWLPVGREILVPAGGVGAGLLLEGLPEGVELAWLREDLEHWARRFSALCGGRAVRGGVVEDGPGIFEQGARERLRMVLTYAGSGVEVQVSGASRVSSAVPGDVVVLKGQRLLREAPRRRTPPGPRLRRMAFFFEDPGA